MIHYEMKHYRGDWRTNAQIEEQKAAKRPLIKFVSKWGLKILMAIVVAFYATQYLAPRPLTPNIDFVLSEWVESISSLNSIKIDGDLLELKFREEVSFVSNKEVIVHGIKRHYPTSLELFDSRESLPIVYNEVAVKNEKEEIKYDPPAVENKYYSIPLGERSGPELENGANIRILSGSLSVAQFLPKDGMYRLIWPVTPKFYTKNIIEEFVLPKNVKIESVKSQAFIRIIDSHSEGGEKAGIEISQNSDNQVLVRAYSLRPLFDYEQLIIEINWQAPEITN